MQCVWFKRDLRVDDHSPLARAARRGPLLALYVYEPDQLAAPECDASHLEFINRSLAELRAALRERGGELVLRTGRMPEVLAQLHAVHRFDTLWSHQETGLGLSFDRDRRVMRWCRENDVRWRELAQHGVFRGRSRRAEGWGRAWLERMTEPLHEAPLRIETVPLADPGALRSPASLGLGTSQRALAQPGGETRAHALLDDFFNGRGADYRAGMSSPVSASSACSRLSPHLAYGTLSMRRVLARTTLQAQRIESLRAAGRLDGRDPLHDPRWPDALESFAKRLRWHCHFIQKLESEPEIEFRNMSRAYDGVREEDLDRWSVDDRRRFDAWVHGQTGHPMIDACMRSLEATGWICFRMRAMLMSFASYDLWLHWRATAPVLARRFVDFEPGIHYAQCQMQSGTTGINANRIYSPQKQAREQDPDGHFIREWVPELEAVPLEYLAAPWTMPRSLQQRVGCWIGADYPAPIVDHEAAVREARRRLARVRQSDEARSEARRVYARHGSRKPASGGRARRSA